MIPSTEVREKSMVFTKEEMYHISCANMIQFNSVINIFN